MQARTRFRNPGGTLFVAGTAAVVAGLVIATLLVMNATLEKALSSGNRTGPRTSSGKPGGGRPATTPQLPGAATPTPATASAPTPATASATASATAPATASATAPAPPNHPATATAISPAPATASATPSAGATDDTGLHRAPVPTPLPVRHGIANAP